MFFAYRCFRIKGTIRLKTCSKMALAGAKNGTTTRPKTHPKSQHTSDQKNIKFSSKKSAPNGPLWGPRGAPRTAKDRPESPRKTSRSRNEDQTCPWVPKWAQKRHKNIPKMEPKSIPIKAPWGNSLRRAAAANGQSGNSKLLNGSAECAERSNSHPDTKCRRWCEHDRFTDGAIFKFAEATFCGTR